MWWRVVLFSAFKCCPQGPGLNHHIRAAGWGIVEGGGAGYQPQTRQFTLRFKNNFYEGQTALLCAASQGLADVVVMLCERHADPFVQDARGRGILQLAKYCQKDQNRLYYWLKKNYPHLPETNGPGRPEMDRKRGRFSESWRRKTNPFYHSRSSQQWDASSSSGGWWS